MKKARAFAPGNISGVFKIIEHREPEKMHSLGMGFTVQEGVIAQVECADTMLVHFNGAEVDFPTVAAVAADVAGGPLRIELESPLPLSCGFGLSGASALATALAADALLGGGRGRRDLALAAHVAEVRNLTGLGDVCAQYHGGCLVKLRPGDPLGAERLAVAEQPVYYRYFGPISTASVLKDEAARGRINCAADSALEGLGRLSRREEVDFDDCIALARRFSEDSGLLQDDRVRALIGAVEATGGTASMIMLGNAVFSTRPFEGATETRLSGRGGEVLE